MGLCYLGFASCQSHVVLFHLRICLCALKKKKHLGNLISSFVGMILYRLWDNEFHDLKEYQVLFWDD